MSFSLRHIVMPWFVDVLLELCEERTCAPLSVNLLQTQRWIHLSEGGRSVVGEKGCSSVSGAQIYLASLVRRAMRTG